MRPRPHTVRRSVLLLSLPLLTLPLLAVVGPATAGPPPAGPHSIDVRVEDHRGRALPEAEIELRWLAAGQASEDRIAARSDAAGRARLAGLAAGSWALTVRHERFMTFVAEVAVSAGKPQIVAARPENVRGATAPLRVRVARGPAATVAARDATPPRPTPPAVRPAEPAVRPTQPPERPTGGSVRPAEPALRPAEPVPAALAPPPVPAIPAPTPAPPPPAPKGVTPPLEEPPATAPAAPAVSPPPVPADPLPAVTPAAPPVPRPSPASGAITRSEPLAVAVRRHSDRTCPECPPGEAGRSVERSVVGGDGGTVCPEGALRQLAEAAPEAWGEIAGAFPAGCAALAMELPAGARYTGYRFESGTPAGWVDCPAGRDCPGLSASWLGDPVVLRQGAKSWLVALFANRSEGPRRARFTAYYREPRP